MNRICAIIVVSCILFSGGCQKPAPQVDDTKKNVETTAPLRPTESSNITASDAKSPTETAADTKSEAPAPTELTVTAAEGSAEAAFQQILVAFQNGRFDAIYDELPERFQKDLEHLLDSFADKMDPDIWSSANTLVLDIGYTMKNQKSLILGFEAFKRSPQIELIKPHWDTISSRIVGICLDELKNFNQLKRLKKESPRRLLQIASKLLNGIPLPKFGDITVKTVKSDDTSAVLLYRESKESEPQEVVFVKVEGKWLPKSIVDSWQGMIRDTDARIAVFCDRCVTYKTDIQQNLDSIKASLVKIQHAKSSEELSQAMIPMIFTIRLGAQSIQQTFMESPRSGHTVKIEINQLMADDEQTKLKDAVLAVINSDLVDYEIVSTDGKTQYRFTSVPDLAALVKLLESQFPDASVRLNADTKTIKVEMK